jgi:hypothetical protein
MNDAGKVPDYVYGLGKQIGYALGGECFAALTSIEDVKIRQDSDQPAFDVYDVRLSVIEYYQHSRDPNKDKPEIDFSFKKIRKPKQLTEDGWAWAYLLNMVKGNKAMFFNNCEQGNLAFETTDAAYFDRIKQGIELTKQFRADYVNAINYFANDYEADDELIKGLTLYSLIVGDSHLIPWDVKAYILVNLLNERSAIMQNRGKTAISLHIIQQLGNYDFTDVLPQYRKQAFINLVKIAGGEGENAVVATYILAKIAVINSDELRPYLRSGRRGNIVINLQKVDMSRKGYFPEPLRKLLSEQ